jgi:hypothetical protein
MPPRARSVLAHDGVDGNQSCKRAPQTVIDPRIW